MNLALSAISGVKNPITLAHAVLDHSRVPDPLGRIPPLFVDFVSEDHFPHLVQDTSLTGSQYLRPTEGDSNMRFKYLDIPQIKR